MRERSIVMGASHHCLSFGAAEDEYMGAEEGFTVRTVGSLIQFFDQKTGGFLILTAVHTGRVRVSIRSWDEPAPPSVDLPEWEDMAIAAVEVPSGELTAQTTFGDGDITGNLVAGPGLYGVRVLGRDRDVPEPDYDPEDPFAPAPEVYLVDIWPAPPEGVTEEARTTSAIGKEIETWW